MRPSIRPYNQIKKYDLKNTKVASLSNWSTREYIKSTDGVRDYQGKVVIQSTSINRPNIRLFWPEKMNSEGKVLVTPKKIAIYIIKINALIRNGKFEELDKALSQIKPESLSTEMMITVLRSTAAVRERLENWENLLESVRKELINKTENHKDLLKGL